MALKPYICRYGMWPIPEPDPDEIREGNSDAILRLTQRGYAPHQQEEGIDADGDTWWRYTSEAGERCSLCYEWIHEGWWLMSPASRPHLWQYVCSSHVETSVPNVCELVEPVGPTVMSLDD